MKFLLLLLIVSFQALAIPEVNYESVWRRDVVPYFNNLQSSEFINAQGMKIRYHADIKPTALRTIVILPGRGEHASKYAEVIYDLRSPDLNVFIMDHQGQGESERLLPNTDKGYVLRFQDYVKDFAQFMREVVYPQAKGTERFLLTHSMGGAVGSHYLNQVPTMFARALLVAPMMKINTAPYNETVANFYAQWLFATGRGKDYAPNRGPYKPEEDTFESNEVTHSQVRFEANKSQLIDQPNLVVGGPTVRWLKEALIASKQTERFASRIKIPVILFQATQDTIVDNGRQNTFCSRAPQCQIILFSGAKHEILMESDTLRDRAMERIKAFFKI